MKSTNNTLRIENLVKRYPRASLNALDDVTIEFTPGIYGILGANGAGKSTLFNILTGIIDRSKGHKKVLKNRIFISFIYTILLYLIGNGIIYVNALKEEKFLNFDALVQSYPILLNFGPQISIRALFGIYIIYGLANIFLLVNGIIYLCLLVKKRFTIYTLALIACIGPLVFNIFFNDWSFLNFNPFSNIFSIAFILGALEINVLLIFMLGSLLLGIGLYRLNIRKWKKIS